MANRAADRLAQASQDLAQGRLSADHGYHEWACFVAHQAVEKALKGLHLSLGQQVWGHGLGRLFRDLPNLLQEQMECRVPDLVERLRILDALYILTRYPDSLPDGAPSDHFGHRQSTDALTHASSLFDAIAAEIT